MRGIRWLALLSLLLMSGCIAIRQGIEFDEEARIQVRFENEEALRLFESQRSRPKIHHTDHTYFVGLPLFIGIERVLHETEWYNHLVRLADLDGNKTITEQEMRTALKSLPKEDD
jgi:hypothetical protein